MEVRRVPLLVSAPTAAQKQPVAMLPQPGRTQLFATAGPCLIEYPQACTTQKHPPAHCFAQTFWLQSLSWYAAMAFHRRCSKLQVGGRANTVSANPPRRGWPSSKPPCAIGAKTPNQNPRGQPFSSTQAFSGDAETTARTNIAKSTAQKNQAMSGPQLPLHKKQTDSEWGAVTSHTAPESSAQRAKRSGPAKSVCFSPDFEYIMSGVFAHLPALNRSPDPVSTSSESSRSRQKPSQYGI
jgi:hypothetical protein